VSVLGFAFVGVRTERFAEVRVLYRDVLGMSMIKDEPQAAWFVTPAGDQVHVYGPADDDHDFFLQGPVVG
jgi:catechol-2,3-dioxygenase